jgi:NAD-dependent dihydropyrimidine dehydrogenase PreA subunit
MSYVIAEPCVDVHDRARVDECPVDRIYDGVRKGYIHPDECVDCGAREAVCPVTAIFDDAELPAGWARYRDVERDFFGSGITALASPGGAARVGAVGVDHPYVSELPPPTPRPKAPGLRHQA